MRAYSDHLAERMKSSPSWGVWIDFAVGLVWRWYLQGSQDVGSASAMTIVTSSCGVRQPKCVQREAITSAPLGTEALT